MKKINIVELPLYLKEIHSKKSPVICTIAGEDSVSAIIKYFRQSPGRHFLPVFMQTGTLIGDYKVYDDNLRFLCKTLNSENCPELLAIDIGILWKILNGRFLQHLVNEFGFVPICIGCHFLIYLVAGTIAYFLNSNVVIGGERKRHGDSTKLNQTDISIQIYKDILEKLFNIKVIFPLENIVSNKEINDIMNHDYKKVDWQTECVLNKNYILPNGEYSYNKDNISKYSTLFLKPFSNLFFNHFKKQYKRNLPLDINIIESNLKLMFRDINKL